MIWILNACPHREKYPMGLLPTNQPTNLCNQVVQMQLSYRQREFLSALPSAPATTACLGIALSHASCSWLRSGGGGAHLPWYQWKQRLNGRCPTSLLPHVEWKCQCFHQRAFSFHCVMEFPLGEAHIFPSCFFNELHRQIGDNFILLPLQAM